MAQQKEGKVVYQLDVKMQAPPETMMSVRGEPGIAAPAMRGMPEPMAQKFEMCFGKNQLLWTRLEEERPDAPDGGGFATFHMMGVGDNLWFCDLTTGKKIQQQEIFDKKFLVEETITSLDWIMSGETKTILKHICRKARSKRIDKHTRVTMKDGKMENEEVTDTTHLTAWFTTDIPVAAGPEVQGQLPGLILELELATRNGKFVYKAVDLSPKVDLASIKPPAKGKKVTPDEFKKEMDKMHKEMEKRHGGRNAVFHN